jgi:hypothetical protein
MLQELILAIQAGKTSIDVVRGVTHAHDTAQGI